MNIAKITEQSVDIGVVFKGPEKKKKNCQTRPGPIRDAGQVTNPFLAQLQLLMAIYFNYMRTNIFQVFLCLCVCVCVQLKKLTKRKMSEKAIR